jgi:hypothetical protein
MRAPIPVLAISFAACACLCIPAFPQESSQTTPASAIPGAPTPAFSATSGPSQPLSSDVISKPAPASVSGFQPGTPLTLHDRFTLEMRTTFGAGAFAVPASEAAITMADPPPHFSHEWSDGAGAFGRIYGADFARHTTGGLTHFAVAAAVREDPRYYPSTSTNLAARVGHVLAFTLVDRSDSGHRTLAISNISGSFAGGFVGMAFYPDGFNDTTHALQRSALELTNFAGHNLTAEFSPEIVRILHKFHFPDRLADSFLPPDRKTAQDQP